MTQITITIYIHTKSAHTALAVKACLLGCKTATLNAQVTFVNIAVAISALAGGGAIQKIEFWVVLESIGVEFEARRALPELVFSYFLADFWVLRSKRVLRWNIGSFVLGWNLKPAQPFLSWCFRIF